MTHRHEPTRPTHGPASGPRTGDSRPTDHDARGDELDAPRAIDRYEIIAPIGRGGAGVVYAALDPLLSREVAIKLVRGDREREGNARLLREARALAQLAHPNVVPVYDVGEHERDTVYLVMEKIEGRSLKQWLTGESWTSAQILDVFCAAGRGLAAAHEAGLVHRDVKPANVLVSHDGRVLVADFGLALADASSSVSGTTFQAETPHRSSSVTQTGLVMGTPAYMAPEQHLGRPTDARADQFSFCVSLYEALYRRRPFAADDYQDLLVEIARGNVVPAPHTATVPRWLFGVISRGLEAKVDDRWPSMDALLAEIERRRAPRTRWWVAATLGAGAVAATTLAVAGGPDVCGGADQRIDAVWSPARKHLAREAFTATDLPYATEAWDSVETRLDVLAGQWTDEYTSTCEATTVRGDQSTSVMDARMACLQRQLHELDALVGVFEHADAKVVERSSLAAAARSDPVRCRSIESVDTPPPPTGSADRVEALRKRLAVVDAEIDAGRFAPALESAEPITAEARALGYEPLLGEALFSLATARQKLGDYDAAAAELEEAYFLTSSNRQYDLATGVASELIHVHGERADLDTAEEWARHADAIVSRGTVSDRRRWAYLNNRAVLDDRKGDFAAAIEGHRSVLALKEQARGPSDLMVLTTVENLGVVLAFSGHFDEGIAYLRRVLFELERTLGPDHPRTLTAYGNLAGPLIRSARHREAAALLESAEPRIERILGDSHPSLITLLNNLGAASLGRGDEAAALRYFERSLGVAERAWGDRHPELAPMMANIGSILRRQGQPERALRFTSRAIGLKTARTWDHPDLATMANAHGDVLRALGRHETAAGFHAHALALYERTGGPTHPRLAYTLTRLGKAELGSGRPELATTLCLRALYLHDLNGDHVSNVSDAWFLLARSLWESGVDRKRALELGRDAKRVLAKAKLEQRHDEVERWLAARGRG